MSRRRHNRRSTLPLRCESLESRTLPSGNPVWTIIGDQQPEHTADTIIVRRSSQNPDWLQAIVNGEVVSTRRLADVTELRVVAGEGNDTVSINVGNRRSDFLVRVWGGAGDDRLTGTNGTDDLRGGTGDDILDGARGRDSLRGGDGDDGLHGGRGIDSLDGGAGHNTFFGRVAPDHIVRLGDSSSFQQDNANPLHQIASADQLHDWIVQNSVGEWSSWFGRSGLPYSGGGEGGGGGGGGGAGGAPVPSNGAGDSGTNNQEDGVEEADILKTDGQFLYTIGGGELLVIDVRTPSSPAIVGRVAIGGTVEAIYLLGDRVVALSRDYLYDGPDTWPTPLPVESDGGFGGGGPMLSWPYFYQSQTTVTTIDITDRTAPTIAHEATLDGSLVDSREVDGRVYVVVENSLTVPPPELIETGDGFIYESEADYLARLDAALLDALPTYSTTDHDAGGAVTGEGSLVEGANVYVPDTAEGSQLLSIAVFDPLASAPAPVAVTTIAGTSGEVYASTESLYVAATDYISPWRDGGFSTQLYKFALDGDAVPLDALGVVDGTVLNQFSMDEEAGFFRIATTSGWGTESTNAVYVMADTGEELQVVGAVENLAETESIYSARFEGDTGYVVTFRQVDPLFVLDMSNPTQPAVVGELKIPGFSSYLQSVGEGLLIGLGRDADPDTGSVGGLQLSLFDVSDPSDPVRLDLFTFSTESWGGYSEAEWDHHALSWFADVGILALPVSVDWEHPATLEVLQLGDSGIQLLGEIAHTSPVLRSLRIGGLLFSMSAGEIQVHDLTNPSIQTGRVELPTPPLPDPIAEDPPGDIGGPVVIRGETG